MTPQLIFLGWKLLGFGMLLGMTGPFHVEHPKSSFLIEQAILQPLLYWGGFYDCFFP